MDFCDCQCSCPVRKFVIKQFVLSPGYFSSSGKTFILWEEGLGLVVFLLWEEGWDVVAKMEGASQCMEIWPPYRSLIDLCMGRQAVLKALPHYVANFVSGSV